MKSRLIFDDVIACDLWFRPHQSKILATPLKWRLPGKLFWRPFFLENTCSCVLGPWPWPRAFLSLASRGSVLGKAVLGLGLGFFLCPWPWPRALCPWLHLWFHHYCIRTSTKSNFVETSARTEKGKSTISFSGPKIWREMPSDMKNLCNNSFKYQYKRQLLNCYTE